MTSAEDARFSARRFHPASGPEWMNSAAEEFPPRFMACGVIFENFKRKYYNLKVRKKIPCEKMLQRKIKSIKTVAKFLV